ncbi:hypothetical protein TNCV_3437791 [Trichonephila clavipes]|nr:hypothetical protein TNCV_3437791 [Trichonephila clavipes]
MSGVFGAHLFFRFVLKLVDVNPVLRASFSCLFPSWKIYGASRGGDVITVVEGDLLIDVPVVGGGVLCATQLHEREHSGWSMRIVRKPLYWLCSSVAIE